VPGRGADRTPRPNREGAVRCPICRQPVIPNIGGNNIDAHRDSIGGICPATGEPVYITEEKSCRTAD
jgi:hypothetical protein